VVGGTNTDNLAVYELDWITGLPTLRNAFMGPFIIRNHTTGSNPLHIALDPRGRFIYVPTDDGIAAFSFTRNPSGPALEAIDADPGTPATIELFQTLGGSDRVVIDPTGQWLYSPGSGGTEGFRIDQATGALTSIGIASPESIVQAIGRL
jgi:DNA-binding beta-propeller fold protein YncE